MSTTQTPRTYAVLFFVVIAACLAGACGKRRPPLPPVESIPQRTELLSGVQRGNQVILSWPAPLRNAPDGSVQSIRRIDVYRLAEPSNAPLPLTEEEFAARSTLIGSVPFAQIEQATTGTLSYIDPLELTEPVRLRYALRYVNDANQRAAFSNFLLIEPASRISQPPSVTGSETRETAIVVRWQAPPANVDGSTPANLLGYNVYRTSRSQNDPAQTPLNSSVLAPGVNEYADQAFTFGEEYVYVVRAVSLGTGGGQVESLNSNSTSVAPQDVFPPSPPDNISRAVSSPPTRISLFFAANPERDVVGYNVYRSTDIDLPKDQWIKLNRTLLERTTFQDETVQSGVKYFYYLTAVDGAGNTSQPSIVISETAP